MLEHESLYTYICKGFIMHFLGTLIALSIVGHHCCRSSWWLHGKTHTIERYEMHGFCYTPWERSWHGISHTAWFLPWGMGFVMLHDFFHVLPYMTLGKRCPTVLPFCDFCVTVVTKQVLFFVHIERRLHFRSQPKLSSETVEPSHTAHRCYNEHWSSTVPPLLTVVPLYTPQCSSTQDALGLAVALYHLNAC